MINLKITPLAKNDLHEIRTYIAEELQSPSASENVIKGIVKKLRMLASFPYMGAPLSSILDVNTDYRFLVCGSYIAFYRNDNDNVYVIRILYNRRDFMKILFGKNSLND
ncbi:MAG: type II toxin-antitoxin system RelE/ParE family toxin [Clostridiales bacterium]|jgi:plasmid stabilization system protein ParE|nr:type II toxin-antitoxin system RelE/ParE family toxin [Clostridiales bacterium]